MSLEKASIARNGQNFSHCVQKYTREFVMKKNIEFESLFPDQEMKLLFAQLPSWTSIQSIINSAKIIENRANDFTQVIHLVFPDNDLLENVFLKTFQYVIPTFYCSSHKIALAARVDKIDEDTIRTLESIRFKPNIAVGPASILEKIVPEFLGNGFRVLVIEDEPHVIELVYEPLQMLRRLLVDLWAPAKGLFDLCKTSLETTGGQPQIVHKHYADGAFASTLEALIYYALGFEVGVQWANDKYAVNLGYKCVDLIGSPPFDPRLIEISRKTHQSMIEDIKKP